MKHRLTQTFPLLLAALLQLLPLVRNFVANAAAANGFAFILRWGIGAGAALESVAAVSGATSVFTTPTSFSGTVGNTFSNKISCTIGGGNTAASSDYFTVSSGGTSSPTLANGKSTTVAMPPGLSFTASWVNNSSTIGGYISGTPTTAGTYPCTVTVVSPGNASLGQAITITIGGSTGPTTPVITNQPVIAATNLIGTTNALFNVVAGGTAPLSYQWYFNTNTALLNQTNAALTLSNIQLTNAGYYRCTITNAAGGTNSANALLTVWQPPVITNQPAGTMVVAGGTVTFSIAAGGLPAPACQWKFNTNTVLAGATGTTLSLTNLHASQAGTYSVTVTNAAGVTNSFLATLTVTNPPPPVLANVVNGGGGKFNFTFTPVPGLTNTVLTNGMLVGGNWGVFTNLPPQSSATPVTLASPADSGNLFYKLMIQP
jgi:hypothetical protein